MQLLVHIKAVSFSLTMFLLLGVSYFGWGRAAEFLLGTDQEAPESVFLTVWLGWAGTLFIFQCLHFLYPVTASVTIPVLLAGLIFAFPRIISTVRHQKQKLRTDPATLLVAFLFITLAIWTASKAMLPPEHVDTGVYHLNSIRWINSYPITPGLGNLHARLAYNQSFFTYAAALNFYPYFGHGRSLANAFLFLLTVAMLLPRLHTFIHQPSLTLQANPLNLTNLFVLPILIFMTLQTNWLGSPAPDLASGFLQIAMFIIFVHWIINYNSGNTHRYYSCSVLTILAATAITIKLSNAVFSLSIVGLTALIARHDIKAHGTALIRTVVCSCIIVLIWSLRGLILSGAPLYPSTIGYVPLEWAVPLKSVVEEAYDIFSQARIPGIHWQNTIGTWNWITPWFNRISHEYRLVYPLMVTIFFAVTATLLHLFSTKGDNRQDKRAGLILAAPLLASFVYWLVTAPDPRFTIATLPLLSIVTGLLVLMYIQPILTLWRFGMTFALILAIINAYSIVNCYVNQGTITNVSLSGWQPLPATPLFQRITASGLALYMPVSGDNCWDSPLPSTPYFNPLLKLRNPADMAAGFTVSE